MIERPFNDPAGIAVDLLAKEAMSHTISLLIGFVADPKGDVAPTIYTASGAFIEFDGAVCLVTCCHVLAVFRNLKKQQPGYKFQIGSFVCDPDERLRDADEGLDLAILDLTDVPIERLRNREEPFGPLPRPHRWPSAPVSVDENVIVCGFPIGTVEFDYKKRKISHVAYPVVERVLTVEDNSFIVSFDRDAWITIPSDTAAPQQIKDADLNGLSGSPVFSGMRNVAGSVGTMEYVGTVLSEVPFGVKGVRARSSRCITADGRIAVPAVG